MKISIEKSRDAADQGGYVLTFDNQQIKLSPSDLKGLLLAITKTLAPGLDLGRSAEQRGLELSSLIKRADAPGLQTLIRQINADDITAFAKSREADAELIDALLKNMSTNAQKMFVEDMQFKYPNGVARADLLDALSRIETGVKSLLKDGGIELQPAAKK